MSPVQFDVNAIYVSNEDESVIPTQIHLSQNYPNPFNPETVIAFEIPTAYQVRLEVYDATGRRVRLLADEMKAAGRHEVTWDARDESGARVASGIYFYQLHAVSTSESSSKLLTGKMVLLK